MKKLSKLPEVRKFKLANKLVTCHKNQCYLEILEDTTLETEIKTFSEAQKFYSQCNNLCKLLDQYIFPINFV
jgi:hypothetical protein